MRIGLRAVVAIDIYSRGLNHRPLVLACLHHLMRCKVLEQITEGTTWFSYDFVYSTQDGDRIGIQVSPERCLEGVKQRLESRLGKMIEEALAELQDETRVNEIAATLLQEEFPLIEGDSHGTEEAVSKASKQLQQDLEG